ncbi:MAG: RNA-binding protein [Rhodospirillaceae bacterium]|nr:RNA-binding protein [Rhodospirillaceae bacterium]
MDAATPTPACPADPDFSGPGGNAPDADSRAGSDRAGGNPRRCAVTRRTGPREGLIRFVVAPDGTLTPDLAETLPGRGVWIAAARDALAAPGLAKAAARSVRKRVSVPDGLADTVERLLAERCRATLGLARRAGLVDAGFDKVRAAIAAGGATLMLTARDSAGRDSRELARRAAAGRRRVRTGAALDSAELGAALGRERLVHVAVADGPLADRLYRDLQRLAGVRGTDVSDGTTETADAGSGKVEEAAHDAAQGR